MWRHLGPHGVHVEIAASLSPLTLRMSPSADTLMSPDSRGAGGCRSSIPIMANTHEILRRMEQIQANRAAAITPLAEILAEREELQRKLAELDEPYGKAYADAEAAGWTGEELAAIGAGKPVKRPKGRPRRRAVPKKGATESAPEASSPAAVPAQNSTGGAAPVGAGAQSS